MFFFHKLVDGVEMLLDVVVFELVVFSQDFHLFFELGYALLQLRLGLQKFSLEFSLRWVIDGWETIA